MEVKRPKLTAAILFFSIFLPSTYLGFMHLDETAFWDDEAQVGIIGRNIKNQGTISGWDGRNLFGYRNGSILDENLRPRNPPLDYIVAAISFKIFKESTFAGRLPFLLFGLGSIVILFFVLKRDFGLGYGTFYGLAMYSLCPVFLLNIRQCRYNALCLFFSILSFLYYRRVLEKKRLLDALGLSLSSVLLFYSHFLICAAFLLTVFGIHLLFFRQGLSRKHYGYLFFSAGLFLSLTVPYAVAFQIWHRPDMVLNEPFIPHLFRLFFLSLAGLNIMSSLPWVLFPFMVFYGLRGWRKKDSSAIKVSIWMIVGILNAFFVSAISIQPTENANYADIRYLMASIPFLNCALGVFIFSLGKYCKLIPPVVLGVVLGCNLLTLAPGNDKFRWMLPAFIKEVHCEYPTAYGKASDFLKANANPEEVVFSYPEFTSFPLMFYNGDALRFGCLLNKKTHLERATIDALNAPLFKHKTYPHWIIFFGKSKNAISIYNFFSRYHLEGRQAVQYRYKLVATLPYYSEATNRPEIMKHTFGPKTDFDPKSEVVFIFRRQ